MAGLSTQELTHIRETLAAGKRPRVMFTETAGQIAGQIGHIVHLDDPKEDEWIMVKFGSDTLPFAPTDLSIPPRGAKPVAAAPPPPPPAAPAPEPEFKVVRETPAAIARQQKQEKSLSTPDAEPTVAAPAPRKPAAGKGKTKAPAGLTVTLAYTEGEWTVGAVQGSKALAKPYVIKPAEALKMVSLLDVPGVHEAVELILSSERAEARAQADKLRAELAELEIKLAELG